MPIRSTTIQADPENAVDYRRMGNIEQYMKNTTSTTSMDHLRDLWKGPRGTVLRIQALAVVAITITFFLAAFGSCRRWSNRWIVQKGFFVAHVLSLSLGTYSIGLMQSSPVKSEMYPIWTVSLFTLFSCIDPVTTYNGHEYKGPLSKMAYQICLHCGYVLLMSFSTISSVVGNTSIVMLSVITSIKGFHRSLALVEQSRMRTKVQNLPCLQTFGTRNDPSKHRHNRDCMTVDFLNSYFVTLRDIDVLRENKHKLESCYDVCIAFSLSRMLLGHFLGLGYRVPHTEILKDSIDIKGALKVIEIELSFLYEIFFTGNIFLHYYQAKVACLWALASFIGICFVGVAAAIPGTMSGCRPSSGPSGGCTNVVDTTTADLVITFVILVSLALLQLMHLIRCWTSNWARVAVACAYAKEHKENRKGYWRRRWMWLKEFVATSTNWSEKYLWQGKIGQYSMLNDEGRSCTKIIGKRICGREYKLPFSRLRSMLYRIYNECGRLVIGMLGLQYIAEVFRDLLGSGSNKRPAIRLDDDVKASIIDFLDEIETDRLVDGNWLSFPKHPTIQRYLPYFVDSLHKSEPLAYRYTSCVMLWHVATLYCELAEQEQEKQDALSEAEARICCTEAAPSCFTKAATTQAGCFKKAAKGGREKNNRNRRVANALSKYCAYLVASAPELLPGRAQETKEVYTCFKLTRTSLCRYKKLSNPNSKNVDVGGFLGGADLGKLLLSDAHRSDVWETLALVWVRLLVYAAPYGDVEAHMQHLRQGGEFITHIWALLYHLDICEWKLQQNLHNITTMEEAERILTDDEQAVIAFLSSLMGPDSDELATVSRLGVGVRFYQTASPDVAKLFDIDPKAKRPVLLFLNKKENEKFTLYDGEFSACAIAYILSAKFALVKQARPQETAAFTYENPIKKKSSEDRGQAVDDIEEEISSLS